VIKTIDIKKHRKKKKNETQKERKKAGARVDKEWVSSRVPCGRGRSW
jgi:hypothetical protein